MTPRKIFVLGATFDTGNMGVGALVAGTIRSIRHAWPRVEISILDYGHKSTVFQFIVDNSTIDIPLINMRFKNVFHKNNVAILILLACLAKILPPSLRERIIGTNILLKNIRSTDLIVSLAGGDSFSDIYGIRRLLYVTFPQILAILLGKKLVQLPQTYGPFKGNLARIIARWILRRSDQIYSRDYKGIEELKKLLGDCLASERVRFSYDVGFALVPVKPPTLDLAGFDAGDEEKPSLLVGLNVSGLLYMGGYNRSNMFGLRLNYVVFTDALLDHIITRKNARVLLVPHVFGPHGNSESDRSVCEAIFDRLRERYPGKLFLARGAYNQGEIKWVIGRCDLFIGARMHACIAALSQCIPTVSVAYSRKFFGVMETIGVESHVVDARALEVDEAIRLVDELFERRKEIRRKLVIRMSEVTDQVLQMFTRIDRDGLVGKSGCA